MKSHVNLPLGSAINKLSRQAAGSSWQTEFDPEHFILMILPIHIHIPHV